MKKDTILVIFPLREQSKWYFEENILPIMPFLDKTDHFNYESNTYRLKLLSLSAPDNLRGLQPDLIFLSDNCSLKDYTNIILPLVKGEHSKVKVVI